MECKKCLPWDRCTCNDKPATEALSAEFALLDALRLEIKEGLALAVSQAAAEVLAGNIVKEQYWRGEITAYRKMICTIANEGI